MTRRGLLAAGVAGAAITVVGHGPDAAAQPRPLVCDLESWQQSWSRERLRTSRQLRPDPYTVALPRPERIGPVDRATLEIVGADVELLPGVVTPMLTYNGIFPGPTLLATPGRPLQLEVVNTLDEGAVLHLHGGHVPAVHDGHVRHVIAAGGGTRTVRYDNRQRPAMLWYHDHLLMRTAPRIYRGLAGGYLLLDPVEADLGLPVGDERDVLVALTDKSIAEDGTLVYDRVGHSPFFGDIVLANGADRPRLDVAAGPVRLRMLNASNARGYRIARDDDTPLTQIGTDGGLLGAPADRDAVELWPGERADLLVDLSGAEVCTQVTLVDSAWPGTPGLLRIEVTEGPRMALAGPLWFPDLEELGEPEVTRTITLDEGDGRFLLNGHGYDGDIRDVHARLGAVERWRLVNTTAADHPMHLHLVSFRVRSRRDSDGVEHTRRPEDEGWKDVVLVRAFETVEVDARFDDHLGDFMYHCHILEHEDHDMMSQFRVVDLSRIAGEDRVGTAAAVAATLDGPRDVVVVADGLDWSAALTGAAVADALLLVTGEQVDAVVSDELARRPPGRIVVAGHQDMVSQSVLDQLSSLADTTRVAGDDPIETAALLAADIRSNAPTAVVATMQRWPDALAAGTLGVPVLLTEPQRLSPVTAQALTDLGVRNVLIAGGTEAVSATVEGQLQDAGHAVERIAGPERTATAAAFARRAGLSETVYAASANRFPDALAAGVAARGSGMLVLVDDSGPSAATVEVMAEAEAARVRIVGGEQALPLSAEADLAALLVQPEQA